MDMYIKMKVIGFHTILRKLDMPFFFATVIPALLLELSLLDLLVLL